jgi:hypothetical protein
LQERDIFKGETTLTTQTNTTASSTLIYLLAEEFAEPATGILHGAPIIAPRSGSKVNAKQLVTWTYQAAFMDLVETGAIRLNSMEARKLFGKENAVQVELLRPEELPVSYLGQRILEAVRKAKKPEARRVREVVIACVGGRSSQTYEWLAAIKPVIADAREAGFVTLPEKQAGFLKAMFKPSEAATQASLNAEFSGALQGEAARLKLRLQAFDQKLGPLAALLAKEIESGVKACHEIEDRGD